MMNDNDDKLTPPQIGKLVAVMESMNMRLHVLERALAAVVALATPEQRQLVARLVDHAGSTYTPVMDAWPQMDQTMRREMDRVIEIYKAMFSA